MGSPGDRGVPKGVGGVPCPSEYGGVKQAGGAGGVTCDGISCPLARRLKPAMEGGMAPTRGIQGHNSKWTPPRRRRLLPTDKHKRDNQRSLSGNPGDDDDKTGSSHGRKDQDQTSGVPRRSPPDDVSDKPGAEPGGDRGPGCPGLCGLTTGLPVGGAVTSGLGKIIGICTDSDTCPTLCCLVLTELSSRTGPRD